MGFIVVDSSDDGHTLFIERVLLQWSLEIGLRRRPASNSTSGGDVDRLVKHSPPLRQMLGALETD